MKKIIIISAGVIVIVLASLFIYNNIHVKTFEECFGIETSTFETVKDADIKEMIANSKSAIIFIADDNYKDDATLLCTTLNQDSVDLAYFSSKSKQTYLDSIMNIDITMPMIIGIKDGEVVGHYTKIDKTNIEQLISDVYGSSFCDENCEE